MRDGRLHDARHTSSHREAGVRRWPTHTREVEVSELLDRAAAMVPGTATTAMGDAVGDVQELPACYGWDVALGDLVDLGDAFPATTDYWDCLTGAAEQLYLGQILRWCWWRRAESIQGVIRADLRMVPTAEGGRRSALPGCGPALKIPMGAALRVAMVAALKSPTGWLRWGSFGEVSLVVWVAPV